MFYYCTYGLHVRSTAELPELQCGGAGSDLLIQHAAVPATLNDPTGHGWWWQTAHHTVLLSPKNAGRFLVEPGIITIDPDQQGMPVATTRLYVYGSCFAPILYWHGLLPLHGSSIVIDDGCVVFVGAKNAGKSTLAAAFHHRGFDVVADDVTAVRLSADGAELLPAFPRLKLSPAALELVGASAERLELVRAERDKRSFPVRHFAIQPVPLRHIYVLEEGDHVSVAALDKLRAVHALLHHSFRIQFLGTPAARLEHMARCATLVDRVGVSVLTRPRRFDALNAVVETVVERMPRPVTERG